MTLNNSWIETEDGGLRGHLQLGVVLQHEWGIAHQCHDTTEKTALFISGYMRFSLNASVMTLKGGKCRDNTHTAARADVGLTNPKQS